MKKRCFFVAAAMVALTACASGTDEGGLQNSSAEVTDTTGSAAGSENDEVTGASDEGNAEASEGAFESWNAQDMANYFKEKGVFSNDDYFYIQTEGEELPEGITNCISYMDDYGDAYVVIFYLAPDSASARTEEIYEEIKTTHQYIMTEAGNYPQPFNALVGRFAIFYSYSLDDQFVTDFEQAYEELLEEYDVQPDFYEQEVELPDEEDDI